MTQFLQFLCHEISFYFEEAASVVSAPENSNILATFSFFSWQNIYLDFMCARSELLEMGSLDLACLRVKTFQFQFFFYGNPKVLSFNSELTKSFPNIHFPCLVIDC